MAPLTKGDKNPRLSTLAFNRQVSMLPAKEKDPRPISDSNFQAESCKKIISYLISHNYEKEVSSKTFKSLSQKDFVDIFSFLLSKFRPDHQYNLKKID